MAGTLGNKGYWNVGIRGSYYRNHRVIYTLCTKTDLPQNLIIDHIDGNKLNNMTTNLQLITNKKKSCFLTFYEFFQFFNFFFFP
jgi:hypothetical protein